MSKGQTLNPRVFAGTSWGPPGVLETPEPDQNSPKRLQAAETGSGQPKTGQKVLHFVVDQGGRSGDAAGMPAPPGLLAHQSSVLQHKPAFPLSSHASSLQLLAPAFNLSSDSVEAHTQKNKVTRLRSDDHVPSEERTDEAPAGQLGAGNHGKTAAENRDPKCCR